MRAAKSIATIVARMGSTRVPGKNLKLLNGKSMIERTINQVKNLEFLLKKSDSARYSRSSQIFTEKLFLIPKNEP